MQRGYPQAVRSECAVALSRDREDNEDNNCVDMESEEPVRLAMDTFEALVSELKGLF